MDTSRISSWAKRHKIALGAVIVLMLAFTSRHWCAALLDGVRHTADLSFTIEWGPTYWVDRCMVGLGRPGIRRLCRTTVDDREHVVHGASSALRRVKNPAYAGLFISTFNDSTVHPVVRDAVLWQLCYMQDSKASDFVTACFRDENQSEHNRWVVAHAKAYRGDLAFVLEARTWSDYPEIMGRSLCLLAQGEPATYLRGLVSFVCDERQPQKLRQQLFTNYEWDCRSMSFSESADANLPEMLAPVFSMNKPDGTPDNVIRSTGWCLLFTHTKKAAAVELANERETGSVLWRMIDAARGRGLYTISRAQAKAIVRGCVTVPQVGPNGKDRLNGQAKEILGWAEE